MSVFIIKVERKSSAKGPSGGSAGGAAARTAHALPGGPLHLGEWHAAAVQQLALGRPRWRDVWERFSKGPALCCSGVAKPHPGPESLPGLRGPPRLRGGATTLSGRGERRDVGVGGAGGIMPSKRPRFPFLRGSQRDSWLHGRASLTGLLVSSGVNAPDSPFPLLLPKSFSLFYFPPLLFMIALSSCVPLLFCSFSFLLDK